MTSTTRREAPARWIAAGLWVGLAAAVARCVLVYAMDHWGRGLDEAMTRWRVAERAPWVLAWGVATGLACAWTLRARNASGRGHAAAAAPFARFVLAAAALLGVLTGWPFDDRYHVPGPGSTRGTATLAGLVVVALAGTAVLAVCARAKNRWTSALARPASLGLAIAAGLALLVAARVVAGSPGSMMAVREVARSIVLDDTNWSVEIARGAAPPHAASVTPSLDPGLDAGEMPSLVMPPPCRVSFDVGPGEDGLRLLASAGCDLAVPLAIGSADAAPTIVFRVTVDGRTVLEHRRTPWAGEEERARSWAHLGGGSGLAVAPGSRVTLETAFEGAQPDADAAALASACGFGGVLLERIVERPRARASAERPNVVLVVMDTLRVDRTSAYGYARPTTPALESLAARGTLYEAAYATSSWTWPSTASILTGLEPGAHGVISSAECWLADEVETLPEALQLEGFTTAAFAGNPLVSRRHNFDAGFEMFESARDGFVTSDQMLPSVLDWIDAHASTRFFLYLHLVDPHELHRADPGDLARFAGPRPEGLLEHALHTYANRLLAGDARAEDGAWDPTRVVSAEHARWLSDAYDAAVLAGDRALGLVLARLDALGLREDTLVVFTSDHGEEFLEHGHLQHGQSLHTELVHVPLVIAGPGVAAGIRAVDPVSNRHLAPTLARVGGARLSLPGAIDLIVAGEARPVYLATECGWWDGARDVPVRAIRADGWSLHARFDGQHVARLYDLRADPGELVDLAHAHPDRVRVLRGRLEEHEREVNALRPRALRSGTGTRELLRASGYAGDER